MSTTTRTRCLYGVVTIALVVGALELSLRAAAGLSSRVRGLLLPEAASDAPLFSPDPVLGYRPNPAYPDHDDWGFRNAGVPGRADVLVFGDSQTYGHGVAAPEAWPRCLGRKTQLEVYSMAFNGYGPVQTLALLDQGLQLEPKLVIEAFYAGNDLFDCWDAVHGRGALAEQFPTDPEVLEAMASAEAAEPLRERIDRLFELERSRGPGDRIAGILRRRSRLFGVWRATLRTFGPDESEVRWKELVRAVEHGQGHHLLFEQAPFRTVFTAAYRLCALDTEDPRIGEGLRIALRAVRLLEERVREAGSRLLVVWIPTKEFTFRHCVRSVDDLGADYLRQLVAEEQLRGLVWQLCEELGVEFVDVQPALSELLAAGIQPYQITRDGHPNAAGQSAIAALVAEHIDLRAN